MKERIGPTLPASARIGSLSARVDLWDGRGGGLTSPPGPGSGDGSWSRASASWGGPLLPPHEHQILLTVAYSEFIPKEGALGLFGVGPSEGELVEASVPTAFAVHPGPSLE
jgi:hypothetical protein